VPEDVAPAERIVVLFASGGDDMAGGAERCLLELVAGLARHSDITPVVVLPRHGEMAETFERLGIQVLVQRAPSWVNYGTSGFGEHTTLRSVGARLRMLRGVVRLTLPWIALLRRLQPQVVVTNTASNPAPALASRLLGIPNIWWIHEFVTEPPGSDVRPGPAFALGSAPSKRVIGWTSRTVVVTSGSVADAYAPPVPRRKVRVIEPGIASPGHVPDPVDDGALHLLLLGRQTPTKGPELAIRAVHLAHTAERPVRLRLVGTSAPDYQRHLVDVAEQLGIAQQVDMVGYAPDPEEHLAWCHALLMCSNNEAFGRVTAEALKRGRPVIGSRSGATPAIVAERRDGLLFTPGDVDELAAAIVTVAEDRELLAQMSRAARTRNRDRFDPGEVERRFASLLHAAAVRAPRGQRRSRSRTGSSLS
jgi:glycosyltransferase involved in cell wall biosynthesis